MKHKLISLLAAAAMTLSVAGTSLAANASMSAAETLTVNGAVALTGVPSTIDYGTILPGGEATVAPFGIHLSTNAAAGATLAITGTDFAGPSPIPTANRVIGVDASSGTSSFSQSYAAGSHDLIVNLGVNVPEGTVSGAYTSTLTFSATTN